MTGVLTTFLVVSLTLLACVVNGQLGLNTTVLCSEVACSDGWICQNACSSWCGVSEPTEARPVCNPKTATHDAPPPTVPANRCSLTDCGFRSVDFVMCPPGITYGYKYAGTSCVRQPDNSCKWELADCQFIPTGPCGEAECGPMPELPDTQIECTDDWEGIRAHYECNRNNLGQCRWQWIPCPTGCPEGYWDPKGLCLFTIGDPCLNLPLPSPSPDCDPTQIEECRPYYCGGCNRRFYDKNRNEICISATRTCANIQCESGYRCYEGQTLGKPVCQNTLTCDNIRCDSGFICNQTESGPTCIRNPAPFILTCDYVQCSSYHTCMNVDGVAQCIPFTGPCSAQDCESKPLCWNNQSAADGTCTRLASGKCVWIGTTCPPEPPTPTSQPNGDLNCLVGPWSAWSCSALDCDASGVQVRTRNVTQAPTGSGLPCPDLIDRGNVCIKECIPTPPVIITPIPTGACANFPGCDGNCAQPLTGATCQSGTWRYSGNVDVSQLSFVGCNLEITGSLTSSDASNLRIHACAKITVSSTATLAGRLSLDIYNVSLVHGNRVTVIQASPVSGVFGTTLVTGFSVTDPSIPFKAGYSADTAYVDFGGTVLSTPSPTTPTPVTQPSPSSTPTPTTGSSPSITNSPSVSSPTPIATPSIATSSTTAPSTASPITTDSPSTSPEPNSPTTDPNPPPSAPSTPVATNTPSTGILTTPSTTISGPPRSPSPTNLNVDPDGSSSLTPLAAFLALIFALFA